MIRIAIRHRQRSSSPSRSRAPRSPRRPAVLSPAPLTDAGLDAASRGEKSVAARARGPASAASPAAPAPVAPLLPPPSPRRNAAAPAPQATRHIARAERARTSRRAGAQARGDGHGRARAHRRSGRERRRGRRRRDLPRARPRPDRQRAGGRVRRRGAAAPHHLARHPRPRRGPVTRASRAVTAQGDRGAPAAGARRAITAWPTPRISRPASTTRSRTLHVEPEATRSSASLRLAYEPRTRRFEAMLDLPDSAVAPRGAALHRVTGRDRRGRRPAARDRARRRDQGLRRHDRAPAEGEFAARSLAIEDVLGFAAKRALQPGQVDPRTPT